MTKKTGENKTIHTIQPFKDMSVVISKQNIVSQEFKVKFENWEGIGVFLSNYNEKDRIVQLTVKDIESGERVFYSEFKTGDLDQGNYKMIYFDNPIINSKNKMYSLELKSNSEDNKDNSVVVWASNYNDYQDGRLFVNGESLNQDISMSLIYSENDTILTQVNYVSAILIVLLLLISLIVFYKKYSISKLFLVYSLLIGSVYTIVIAPSTDEWAHFYRAYSVSQGNFILPPKLDTTGDFIPASLRDIKVYFNDINSWKESFAVPLNQNEKVFVSFPNSGVYSPVPYLSQSIGILIGRILSAPPIIIFYLARIFNLFTWIYLIYLCLKLLPYGRIFMFALAMLPIIIQTAASCSADGLLFSISFLLISFILRLVFSYKVERVSKKDLKIIFLLIIIISLCKPGYFLLSALLLLIPKDKLLISKKMYWSIIFIILGIGFGISALWSFLVTDSAQALSVWMQKIYGPGIDSEKQLSYLVQHPVLYIKAMINTINIEKQLYLWQLFLKTWVTSYVPNLFIIIYSAVLLFVVFVDTTDEEVRLDIKSRTIMILVFLLISGGIFTIFYLSLTPVGAGGIKGTQGRYFIPIIPLLLLPLKQDYLKLKLKNPAILLIGLSLISFIGVMFSVTSYYLICK